MFLKLLEVCNFAVLKGYFPIQIFIGLIVFVFPSLSFSQHVNIKIEKPLGATYFAVPCEPSVAMNPENPSEMVIGSVLDGVHISNDTGLTWKSELLKSSHGVEGDPCVLVDNKGVFHYFHLANPKDGKRLCCIVHQSLDLINGEWTNGFSIGNAPDKNHDKEWAVVDRKDNSIYLFWSVFDKYKSDSKKHKSNIAFSKFNSKEKVWSTPVYINKVKGDCCDDDNSLVGVSTCVGPESEVYVLWSGLGKIWFDRSFDGGKTWLKKDMVIAEQPGGWKFEVPGLYRCSGFPSIVCDTSKTKFRGNLYAVWSDQSDGEDNTTIYFAKSTDKGQSWSEKKSISKKENHYHQFFPSLTVDYSNGRIWILFYDRRNSNDENTEVYLAFSDDGGETFKDFRISKSPFSPDKEMFLGDYTSIVAYNNIVRPVWTRLDGYSLSLWTALIDEELIGVDKPYVEDIITGNEENIIVENSYELESDAWKNWNTISEQWFENNYRNLLEKYAIEMNCSDCEYAYIDFVIYISYEGKIVKYETTKSNICGDSAGESIILDFIQPLLQYKFPKNLHNKALRIKLGSGLKC